MNARCQGEYWATRTNGDKEYVYRTLLDAGIASFATDFPTQTKAALKKYYEDRE
ncbi:MAG: hypothetical protein IJU03_07130 [Thermoguttaceae bacterium]|nr:hypothetical protein [Thermoguttaceae bacterium]